MEGCFFGSETVMKIDDLIVSHALSPNLVEARANLIKVDGHCVGRYCGGSVRDFSTPSPYRFLFAGSAPIGSNGLIIDVRSGESYSGEAYICMNNLVSGTSTIRTMTNRLSAQFIVPGTDAVDLTMLTGLASIEYLNGVLITVDVF
jgi:hypothetical protein